MQNLGYRGLTVFTVQLLFYTNDLSICGFQYPQTFLKSIFGGYQGVSVFSDDFLGNTPQEWILFFLF